MKRKISTTSLLFFVSLHRKILNVYWCKFIWNHSWTEQNICENSLAMSPCDRESSWLLTNYSRLYKLNHSWANYLLIWLKCLRKCFGQCNRVCWWEIKNKTKLSYSIPQVQVETPFTLSRHLTNPSSKKVFYWFSWSSK